MQSIYQTTPPVHLNCRVYPYYPPVCPHHLLVYLHQLCPVPPEYICITSDLFAILQLPSPSLP